jgi:hypothetical protein
VDPDPVDLKRLANRSALRGAKAKGKKIYRKNFFFL